MIKFYVNINQLHNFLIYKEPIQLINEIIDNNYIEFNMDPDKLIFTEYNTYITVELRTFKKGLIQRWKKIKNLFKKK